MSTQVDHEAGSEERTASNRKVQANRQNASKSTGPRTPRGKSFSRMNALKHGLFAMDLYIATLTKWEDPDEYENLLVRLAEAYQPVGAAEELEVQRIAMCWWKLSRVWRYENAQIAVKLCTRHAELNKIENIPSEDQVRLVLLKNAKSEIKVTGRISDELKGKMFADRELGKLWESVEAYLNEFLARRIGLPPPMMKEVIDENPAGRTQFLLGTARHAALALVRERGLLIQEVTKLSNDIEAIPPAEALDGILRADAAADRSLRRAMDQLERLQRRRRGEPVPPPVSVRLTR
jgi:hypothetical protein